MRLGLRHFSVCPWWPLARASLLTMNVNSMYERMNAGMIHAINVRDDDYSGTTLQSAQGERC